MTPEKEDALIENMAMAFIGEFYEGCGIEIRDPYESSLDDEELGRWKALIVAMRAALSIAKPIIRDEALEEAEDESAPKEWEAWSRDAVQAMGIVAKRIAALKSKGQKPS